MREFVERLHPSGGWLIADERHGQWERRRYFGYTKKEALAEFRAEFPLRKTRHTDEA